MKHIICLAFVVLCACGADGEPEQPLSLLNMSVGVPSN